MPNLVLLQEDQAIPYKLDGDVVGLAVLELIKRRRVTFEQDEPFDDIRLFARAAA